MERSRNQGGPRTWARAAFALDTRSLAAYRIALGGLLVADCLLRSRDFRLMHLADGMLAPEAIRGYFGSSACWSLALVSPAAGWAASILALEGLAGILLAWGFHTRLATMLAWVVVVSLVRRTAPATNAGDSWLVCQLFWGMFLPLGARWSADARRQPVSATTAWSVATVALVVQIALVYLGAGLGKCNPTWWSGEALGHALSVHDHGTAWGAALARADAPLRVLSRGVPGAEIAAAVLLLAWPTPAVRGLLIAGGVAFHAVIWVTMSVGLFAPIAIVAWLPLVPAVWWSRLFAGAAGSRVVSGQVGLPWPATLACGGALALATAGFVAGVSQPTDRPAAPLPAWLDVPLDLLALHQEWAMFGDVLPQEQWVVGAATLHDGRTVDLLRGGAPINEGPPDGGFTTLRHHRWHKLVWVLHEPDMQIFAPGVAAALVRAWNDAHPPAEHVRSLEVRHARRPTADGAATIDERLVASWPPRSAAGAGSLERFLRAADSGSPGE